MFFIRFEIEEGAVFGFGVEGEWESEFVPKDDASYYYTKNGRKVRSLAGWNLYDCRRL